MKKAEFLKHLQFGLSINTRLTTKKLNMKLRLLYTTFSLALLAIISLSNVGGRAGGNNQGNTGAPGDQMQGSNPRTCQSCHATGDIQVTLALDILDADNNPITAYIPNEVYTTRIRIEEAAESPQAAGYGFQVVSLLDGDNSDVNGWTDEGHSDNVQIAASTNTNRVYAEHKGRSESNEFLIKWQAPAEGSGDVSFYAAGNGVNGNGSTSGDGAATPQKLTLSENAVSSISDLSSIGIDLGIAPNPSTSQLFLTLNSSVKEVVTIKIINPVGQVFYQKNKTIQLGKTTEIIDLTPFASGIYLLQVSTNEVISTKKIIKK